MGILGHPRRYVGIMISTAQVTREDHTTTDSYAGANINDDLTIEYCPPHPELHHRSHEFRTGSATPSQATVRNRVKPFMMKRLRERV